MVRSDKKNTICERCGHKYATPQKLRDHLNRKFKCKPLEVQQPDVRDPEHEHPMQTVSVQPTVRQPVQPVKCEEKGEEQWINVHDRKPGEQFRV